MVTSCDGDDHADQQPLAQPQRPGRQPIFTILEHLGYTIRLAWRGWRDRCHVCSHHTSQCGLLLPWPTLVIDANWCRASKCGIDSITTTTRVIGIYIASARGYIAPTTSRYGRHRSDDKIGGGGNSVAVDGVRGSLHPFRGCDFRSDHSFKPNTEARSHNDEQPAH